MDLLFRVVTPRNLLILALVLGFTRLWPKIERYPRRMYREWRYPPQSGGTAAGQEVLDRLDRREAKRVEARFRRVAAKLARARTRGLQVDGLQAKARAALTLNVHAYRRQAIKVLIDVEMAIPREKTQYIPMHPSEEQEEVAQDVPPSKPRPLTGRR